MFFCPICLEPCPTDKYILAHWKLKHNAASCYVQLRCKQYECSRTFSDIYSFKKHLVRTHMNDFVMKPYPSIENEIEILDIENQLDVDDSSDPLIENVRVEIFEDVNNQNDLVSCRNNASLTTPDSSQITSMQFAANVNIGTASFVTKLYANNTLSRVFVQETIHNVQLILNFIQVIKKKYNHLHNSNHHKQINEMFDILENSFENHQTEHQTMKYLHNLGYLIPPQRVVIDAVLEPRRIKNKMQISVTEKDLYVIPLKILLRKFLMLPGIFDSILAYMNEIRQSCSTVSVLQGDVWKKIEKKFNNIVLPLMLYFDDFEINNPLGTHRGTHKLGAVYCNIACLPPVYSSVLENIFLVQLHNTTDHRNLGNKVIFSNIINQCRELETDGINVEIRGSSHKVNFALLSVIGDNLGLNSILGFTSSFNSNHYCRLCTVDKNTLSSQVVEDKQMLRTVNIYETDTTEHSNGIVEECIFNQISSFHVLQNISFDLMHDLFEGICRYEAGQILNRLVNEENLFSLETLNNRIRFFDYGVNNDINIPPPISKEALRKRYIIYTASEMNWFIQYLGLFIGDLIPEDNKTWRLYTLLRDIICIITAPSFVEGTIHLLKSTLSEHHSLYLDLFNEPLKPNHHFVLHYPLLMEKIGPAKYISSMRFEAKHKECKNSAKVITSRKNPAYTLALKQQLQVGYRLLTNKGFQDRISLGIIVQKDLSFLSNDANFQCAPFFKTKDYTIRSWASVDGILYKPQMIVKINVDDLFSYFGQIQYIIVDNVSSSVNFILKELTTLRFSLHVHAFEVIRTDKWTFMSQEQLFSHAIYSIHTMADAKLYVPCT